MSGRQPVEVSGEVVRETDAAYCFTNGGPDIWLPKSQVSWEPDDDEIAGEGIMTVPYWLAYKTGLI